MESQLPVAFWKTIYDVISMQNGIKMNKLKYVFVKMISYDKFWWLFIAYLIFYIFLVKQYLL